MDNWKGMLRERIGSIRTALALTHPHLLRMRLKGTDRFRDYAEPVFHQYLRTLCHGIQPLDFVDALEILSIDSHDLAMSIPKLGGYVGLQSWDQVLMALITRHYGSHPCFEIGTAAGATTLLMANNISNTVYTLDLPSNEDNEFALTRLESDDQVITGRKRASLIRKHPVDNIVELVGDSATFDYTPYHGSIGLFFIDGAHSYEYVRSDTINATKCCVDDGIIVWDDFASSRDVNSFIAELTGGGVKIFNVPATKIAFSTDMKTLRWILSTDG